MKVISEFKVTKEDIDLLGHMNNSVYINYLEKAREGWYIRAAGLSFSDMKKLSIGTVVIHLDILFKKEAVLGDILVIHTSPERIGNKSFVFQQEIYNQKEELLTKATVTNVMFDTLERKGIPVIQEIARNFINQPEESM